MTNLTIHLPDSDYFFTSDGETTLNELATFCQDEFGAVYSSENGDELTIDGYWDEEKDIMLSSKLIELGLINS